MYETALGPAWQRSMSATSFFPSNRLHQHLATPVAGQPDQKLYRTVWALLKQASAACAIAVANPATTHSRSRLPLLSLPPQVPLLHVAGRAQWRPLSFLARHLPLKARSMSLQAAEAREKDYLKTLDFELPKEIQIASLQAQLVVLFLSHTVLLTHPLVA